MDTGAVVALAGTLGLPNPDGSRSFAFASNAFTPGATYAFHAFAFTSAGKGADGSPHLFAAPPCFQTLGGAVQASMGTAAPYSFQGWSGSGPAVAANFKAPPAPPAGLAIYGAPPSSSPSEDHNALDALVDSFVHWLVHGSELAAPGGEQAAAVQ